MGNSLNCNNSLFAPNFTPPQDVLDNNSRSVFMMNIKNKQTGDAYTCTLLRQAYNDDNQQENIFITARHCIVKTALNPNFYFEAGESIDLIDGFTAEFGSDVTIEIKPCNPNRLSSIFDIESNIEIDTVKENNLLSIYPNPSTGIFTIESKEFINPQQIELYDIFGKRIQPLINQNGNVLSLNLIGHSKGMYFIKIGTYSQKIIVE